MDAIDMTRRSATVRRAGEALAVAALLVLALTAFGATAAHAAVPAPVATPSDPRAEMFEGNAVSCDQVGFGDSTQMGDPEGADAADAYVSGTTSDDRYLDVTITAEGAAEGVVVDAVVMKGGNGYNLYSEAAVLPPALPAPQQYLSPLVGSGNVPGISHWFVCYHFDAPPQGSLLVEKDVLAPSGTPVDPLPETFTVVVTCDTPGFTPVTLSFGAGGGVARTLDGVLLTGLEVGAICGAVELFTDAMPEGTVVSYSPAQSVEIPEGPGATISVVNDFSGVAVVQGAFTVAKVVAGDPSTASAPFVIDYACTDGSAGSLPYPSEGGISSSIDVPLGDWCAVAEDPTGLDAGWSIDYAVDGTVYGLDAPVFLIDGSAAAVTVTNTFSAAPSPSPPPGTGPPPPAGAAAGGPRLAESGAAFPAALAALGASALLFGGAMAMRASSSRRAGTGGAGR